METSRHQRQRWENIQTCQLLLPPFGLRLLVVGAFRHFNFDFPNLLQSLDLSYSIFWNSLERGGRGQRGRAWIPRVGRFVYLQFPWGLVAVAPRQGCARFLWGAGEEGGSLANLFWLHTCSHGHVYVQKHPLESLGWLTILLSSVQELQVTICTCFGNEGCCCFESARLPQNYPKAISEAFVLKRRRYISSERELILAGNTEMIGNCA